VPGGRRGGTARVVPEKDRQRAGTGNGEGVEEREAVRVE